MSISQTKFKPSQTIHGALDGAQEDALWRAIGDRDGQAVMNALKGGADHAMSLGTCGAAVAWAIECHNFPALMLVLSAGADPNLRSGSGMAPLSLAIGSGFGERDQMVSALLEFKADPNAYGSDGENHLIFAARKQRETCVRLLLAAGADPNAAGKIGGYTALMWASYFSEKQMVLDLVAAGAKSDALGADGRAARDWSTVSGASWGSKSQEVLHILDVTSVKAALIKEVGRVEGEPDAAARPPRL